MAGEDEAPEGAPVEAIVAPPEDQPAPPSLPEPPASPSVDEAPVAPAPSHCAAQARDSSYAAVVRVRSGSRWGAGFVFGSPRRVVTSFSLLTQGRHINVVTPDGAVHEAELVARDEEVDVAILELSEAIEGLAPIPRAGEGAAEVGAPVVVMGHPHAAVAAQLGDRGRGLLRWSPAPATITGINEYGLQVHGSLGDGHVGGPVLACDGSALGMVTGPGRFDDGITLAAHIDRIAALLDEGTPREGYDGAPRLRFGVGAVMLFGDDPLRFGAYLALGGMLYDRLSWITRVGLSQGGAGDPGATELSIERTLVRIESLLGWRFFIDVGGFFTVHVEPSLGAVIGWDQTRRSTASVVPDGGPGCMPDDSMSCARVDIARTADERVFVRPAAGLTLYFGDTLEVGYTFEIDVDQPGNFHHAARVGLLF